ncbi:MAG: hypothetical protein PVG75_00790 [Thioalkalispiraceae bacterium]|jgi:type II secretory pathway component GspD/PulD (secretin)
MKKILALALLLVSSNLWSAMIIESIQLRHRPAEEIIPLIKPMLAADASITGTGYKLIIKSTPENLEQVKNLLKQLDVNQNLLRVSVSMGRPGAIPSSPGNRSSTTTSHADISARSQSDAGSVSIGSTDNKADTEVSAGDDKIKFNARIYQTERAKEQTAVQVMSVAEGYWANISMGQAIPFTTRSRNPDGTVTESVTYQEILTGYQVMPRTHNGKVTLTIRPYQQSTQNNYASVQSTEMQTTITGNLGEWLYIGGINHEENLDNSGISYQTRIRSTDINEVWVKVERP